MKMETPMNNGFSWRRMAMVARFYYPRLRMQMILYPLLSLAMMVLTLFSANLGFWSGVLSPLGFISTLLLSFGPLVFLYRDSPEVEILLPARGSEKAIFVLFYSVVAIPVMISLFQIILSPWMSGLVYNDLLAENIAAESDGKFDAAEFKQIMSWVSGSRRIFFGATMISLLPCVVTTYAIMRSRANRVMWAVVGNVIFVFSIIVLCFLFGVYCGMTGAFDPFVASVEASGDTLSPAETVGSFMPVLEFILFWSGVLCLVTGIVLIGLAYRAIIRRQAY